MTECRRYTKKEVDQLRCPSCGGFVGQLSDSWSFECYGTMSGHPQTWGCGWLGMNAKNKS
jgi:hypothetical protein